MLLSVIIQASSIQGRVFFRRGVTSLHLVRKLNSSIPTEPVVPAHLRRSGQTTTETQSIDNELISHLERISLVEFGNEEGIKRLEEAIKFVQPLKEFEFEPDVTPMFTVLEDESLTLRDDEVTEGGCRQDILKNATVVAEEDFFLAPPGNIALTVDKDKYKSEIQK